MSLTDRQYVAISGQPDGSLLLIDWRQPPGGNHVQLRQAGDFSSCSISLGNINAPAGRADILKIPGTTQGDVNRGWQDALKVSGCINLTVTAGEVTGGDEDVVDVNHSNDVTIVLDKAIPKGRHVSTIKGGSQRIKLIVATQVGHGSDYDHDCGNWSDQSSKRSESITYSSPMQDGSASTARILHAVKKKVFFEKTVGKWKINSWMSPFFYFFMSLAKKLGIK